MRADVVTEAEAELRRFALSLPEAVEDFPWGERVVKVRGKIFAFIGRGEDGGLSFTGKLPETGMMALMLPFAEPTGHNLGRSGWVTAGFGPDEPPPVRMLKAWMMESYRAVAPKKLVALLPAAGAASAPASGAGARRPRVGKAIPDEGTQTRPAAADRSKRKMTARASTGARSSTAATPATRAKDTAGMKPTATAKPATTARKATGRLPRPRRGPNAK